MIEATIKKPTEVPDAKKEGTTTTAKRRGPKRAIEFGITATVRHYASLYPTRDKIPISTIATWKAKYLKELKMRVRERISKTWLLLNCQTKDEAVHCY